MIRLLALLPIRVLQPRDSPRCYWTLSSRPMSSRDILSNPSHPRSSLALFPFWTVVLWPQASRWFRAMRDFLSPATLPNDVFFLVQTLNLSIFLTIVSPHPIILKATTILTFLRLKPSFACSTISHKWSCHMYFFVEAIFQSAFISNPFLYVAE